MLTKPIGPAVVLTMTATAQTATITTNEIGTVYGQLNKSVPATKIRIATGTQPAFITIDGTTATTTTSILIPANSSEHFKIEVVTTTTAASTASWNYGETTVSAITATVSVLQAGTGGLVSIVAVA